MSTKSPFMMARFFLRFLDHDEALMDCMQCHKQRAIHILSFKVEWAPRCYSEAKYGVRQGELMLLSTATSHGAEAVEQ
jgi:hypothetical protein